VYEYYAGRNAVLEEDPRKALQHLQFAWNALGAKRHGRNRRLVLEYLVPVYLALGYRPSSKELLEINKLSPVLASIVNFISFGNARAIAETLERNQDYLCKRGIYAILARTRMVALRNLFKFCVQLHRETCEPSERNKFPLFKLYPAIKRWDDYDSEDDLTEHTKCVVVNLIHKGLVKGYVSYEREIVVLSANDAFPKTAGVVGRDS